MDDLTRILASAGAGVVVALAWFGLAFIWRQLRKPRPRPRSTSKTHNNTY